jgi:AcrR family transcriptional regulator
MTRLAKLETRTDGFEELEPDCLTAEADGWRQRRSNETRVTILEAALNSLAHHGYAQTTLQTIAVAAKLSRSAMVHHFSSKQELINAVADYAFFKRMVTYREHMSALSEAERLNKSGIDIAWDLHGRAEYRAYSELAAAARTDSELAAIFYPKARTYDRIWREETARLFPEWGDRDLTLACDLTTSVLQGLAMNHRAWGREREAALVAFLKAVLDTFEPQVT